MNIGGSFLTEREKELFVSVLYEFEGALAFDESEMGLLHESIEPPIEIHTVPHELGNNRIYDFRELCEKLQN